MHTLDDQPAPPHRITLKAYACGHRVEMLKDGRVARAALIDISQRGARLLADGPAEDFASPGDHLGLNILLDQGGLQSGPAPCVVTWSREREIDVEFPVRLDLGLAELQAMVDHPAGRSAA